ncbi:RlpA-like double-psi beta-barrel-protein domain-containing protein-containing protein, partial [Peziza echinospora]
GDLTYYTPGLGSCGLTHTSSDAVVAISHTVFDAANISGNPNENPLCGRKVRAMRYREDLGRNVTVEAMVVDRCPACKAGDLDVSEAVFAKLARMEMGRVGVVWSWV